MYQQALKMLKMHLKIFLKIIKRGIIVKKILLIILLTIMLLCMCGCSINNESSSKSKEDLFVEQAEKHLKQKYPELEYSLGDVQFGTMWDDPDDTIEVTIENGKFVGRTFQIRRKTSNNPNKELTDNYFGYLVRDDFENIIKKYAKKYFTNYQLSGDCSEYFENELTSKNTFEDARRSKNFSGYILLVVKPTFLNVEVFKKKANEFLNDYKQECLKTNIQIYYLKSGIYEDLDIAQPYQFDKKVYDVKGYETSISENVN